MPKVGMEPIRRQALIDATIAEIGQAGSLSVTVSQIAKRAGMSSGLAHHYFGSKEQIFVAAMRHILRSYGEHIQSELRRVEGPKERLDAIIAVSFHPLNFAEEVVSAWLNFYVYARTVPEAKRLLEIYGRRLHSNLVYNLSQLMDRSRADHVAQGLAAMIDGFYIRHALQENAPARVEVMAMVDEYLRQQLQFHGNTGKS
ncbi:transcriptional regulator BetI [Neptunicoccus sediminis]|uniref:transcriptional regulator BetI n=1 Tax=Neptunicoccus sediminis TaxID=1892596 RepID=UPI0008461611|nr:transcriptional regulator BetI [Neptunicoccus sediminis]